MTDMEKVFMRQHKLIRCRKQRKKICFSYICMKDVSFRCSARFSSSIAFKNFKRDCNNFEQRTKGPATAKFDIFPRCHEWIRENFPIDKIFKTEAEISIFISPQSHNWFWTIVRRGSFPFQFQWNLPYQDRQNNILEFLELIVFFYF